VWGGELSGYYSRYERDNASFTSVKGNEIRDLYDVRHMGKKNNIDWDVEGMLQHGRIGGQTIQAWGLSSITGYTFAEQAWSPRLGVQFDIATGDKNANDNELNTFNQLFANGSYFTLAGYSGYSNIIHLKPSLTLKPSEKLTLLTALGFQWRETTNDAIYFQGNNSMSNTAGQGSSWTGAYIQLRADQKINSNLSVAAEGVHFEVGDTIKKAGGKDSNYLGLELKYAW
jgi:Alginate export